MGQKICIIVGYGQSNEQGSAVTGSGASAMWQTPYGFPLQSTSGRVGPSHVLAQKLGAEGHAVWLRNLAWGGTGILGSWNGYVRTWVASSNGFAPGSWALPTVGNGFKYLAGGTPGISQSTAGTEPTWPTTVGATVVDNTVTWTCYFADSKDVANYVYQNGDSGYDPRGYIAAVLAAVADAKSKGYAVWVLTSGHQSDYGNNVNTVSGILANMMRRVLAAGADRVYFGITNRYIGDASSVGWDAGGWYHLVRNLALAQFTNDTRVKAGADLSNITTEMTDPAGRVHLNDIGVQYAGQLWRDTIIV
jgi:hypothetical protein